MQGKGTQAAYHVTLRTNEIYDYISWIRLVFMFQEQIWSRDHSKVMALMSTKYKTPFLYHMTYFHPFGTICLAWVLFFWCSLISMLQEQVPIMNTP